MDQIDAIDALARRLPEHAWTIRRLHRRNAEFRALCADFGEALSALEHWRRTAEHELVREYDQLTNELEEEILTFIEPRALC
ncbi:MAG: hypothetical protein AAF637_22255 [Pseudomonadota bacterium]